MRPAATTGVAYEGAGVDSTRGTFHPSLDAIQRLGSVTAIASVNTDFAETEVDTRRTNLTRFPLFFPEKRPFFLENAGVFSAGTPQAVDLFFTRRIGIDSLGQPVPILGGGRVRCVALGSTDGMN